MPAFATNAAADDTHPLVVDCRDFNVVADVLYTCLCEVAWLLGHPIIRMAIWKFWLWRLVCSAASPSARLDSAASLHITEVFIVASSSRNTKNIIVRVCTDLENPSEETLITITDQGFLLHCTE